MTPRQTAPGSDASLKPIGADRARRKLAFFVRLADPGMIATLGFYRDDLRALKEFGFDIQVITRLRDLIGVRADVFYAWWFGFGFFCVVWARLLRKPVIVSGAVHSVGGGELATWPWHKRWLMRLAMRWATKTLFISCTDFERLREFQAHGPAVIYCAVDLQSHRPAEPSIADLDRAAATGQQFVLSISHLTIDNVRRKMVLESIDAFARFHAHRPEYRYVLAGVHGNALRLVRQRIELLALDPAVELPGRISFEHKLRLLQTATAYLQPSRCEGFGLAILEAQACGCPVVTNRERCIVEINGAAVLYGETADQLADRLHSLATDPELRRTMRERGLKNAQRFSYEARRDALRTVLQSIGVLDANTTAVAGATHAS